MPPAVDHPDADALTAFAEQSLPEGERVLVLEHLARCGDCRDIVALALPEPDAAQAVTLPGRSGWLTWPALRWGFAAAGIVVIASFGVLEHQRSRPAMSVARYSRQENISAKVQSPVPAASTPTPQPQAVLDAAQPSAHSPAAAAPAKLPEAESLSRPAPRAVHGSAVGGMIGGQLAHGPMPMQLQQQATTNQQQAFSLREPVAKQQSAATSANLGVPSTSQPVNVEAAAAQLQTSQAEAQVVQNRPAPLPSPPAEQLFEKDASAEVDKVDKAKPALNVTGRDMIQLVALTPRWAINSAGGLQRSLDQGKTWQDVDVTAGAALSAGAKSLTAVKAARTKEYYADKKTLKAPASAPLFRAVAVTGPDIWAGGSQGVLYHSADSGNQWAQVVPSSAGITLTGDIVGLVFSDARHGTITTSTGEIWITTDQGQTWQKQ